MAPSERVDMATIRRKRVLRRDGRQRRAETARASASFMAVAWEMHRAPHLAMHPAHILGSVALLSAALYACVFKRVDAPTLTLVARNRNELAQLCRATRTILALGRCHGAWSSASPASNASARSRSPASGTRTAVGWQRVRAWWSRGAAPESRRRSAAQCSGSSCTWSDHPFALST
jgi:hypothetical protein